MNNKSEICEKLWNSIGNSDFNSLLQSAVEDIGIENIIIESSSKYSDIYCIPLFLISHQYILTITPLQWGRIIFFASKNVNALMVLNKYFTDYVKKDIKPILTSFAVENSTDLSRLNSLTISLLPDKIIESQISVYGLTLQSFDSIRNSICQLEIQVNNSNILSESELKPLPESQLNYQKFEHQERLVITLDAQITLTLVRVPGEKEWKIIKTTVQKYPPLSEIVARLPEQYR